MPVQKFRSFQEAEEALWRLEPDQDYYDQIGDLWHFAHSVNPAPYPRGVFKFRSIEEANKHMDEVVMKRALELDRKHKQTTVDRTAST